MNVGELIERVRLEVHNDLTDKQIVGRFNELSSILFRKFVLPEAIYAFETSEIPYYNLPEDCTEDSIRCVSIDDVEYIKVTPQTDPPCNYCTVYNGALYISDHAPNREAFLLYRARPIKLSEERLDEEPNFPQDYHTLYIYDAAQWIAGIQRDVDMKNNFFSEYSSILRDAEKDLRKMGMQKVKITTEW